MGAWIYWMGMWMEGGVSVKAGHQNCNVKSKSKVNINPSGFNPNKINLNSDKFPDKKFENFEPTSFFFRKSEKILMIFSKEF